MRCETSFFSLTLYKKHLTRNWPLWAVWLGLWLLILPVQIWNRSAWYYSERDTLRNYAADLPVNMLNVLFPMLALLAILAAVAVYFHLFKSNSANFVGALPLRREGVFATAFAAGYTMLVAPLIVVGLVTILVELVLGVPEAGAIGAFIGAGALVSFFWFSFATLCCVISGHGVAAAAFYAIFNAIVPIMVALVEGLLTGFLYGFVGFGDGFYEVTNWLCPMLMLSRHGWWKGINWEMLAIYAAVGFLMFLSAIGLHHIRKAERSGDLIAFDPIKWLFKICVTICGGLAFGTLFTFIIFNSVDLNRGWEFGICCAAAAFICYMVAEMLLAKSFKVWKHWKGAAVSAVAFVLLVAAVDMDWIGFTTRVPSVSSVKSATAYFGGTSMSVDAANGLEFTGEDVAAVEAVHQYLIDHRNENGGGKAHYLSFGVEYNLGWTKMERRYTCRYDRSDELGQLLEAALDRGKLRIPREEGVPSEIEYQVKVVLKRQNEETGEYYDDTEYISGGVELEDIKAVWAAALEDMDAGRYKADLSNGEDGNCLYLRWYENGYTTATYQLTLSKNMTATWSLLESKGYLNADQPVGTYSYEIVG